MTLHQYVDGDALRWLNVVLSMIVVAALVAGAFHRWHVMPKRFQRITPWVIGTYVIIAAAAADVEPGLRVALLTLDLIGLVIVLLYRIGDDTYDEH